MARIDHQIDFYPKELLALRPPPNILVSGWADERRILQPGTSRQPGPWITETTPYLRAPMDAYNDPDIREITLCFGTQLGKTECLYNMLGYIIDLEPYSTLLIYPREDDAKTISRTRLQPMIEANPSLREKKPAQADLYQTLEMHFQGMALYMVGANSASALAQKPCRNVLRDEIDKYPNRVGKDADPLSLSEERTKSFWDIRKIVNVSSPTEEGFGIWKQLQECDEVKYFHVPCPYCGEFQKLVFVQVIFDRGTPSETRAERINRAKNTAHYECRACRAKIGDDHRAAMLAAGQWETDKPSAFPPEKIGFHLSSLYSPWLTWGDIAAKFLGAHLKAKEEGIHTDLQNFINGWLAEPWVQRSETVKESDFDLLKTDLPAGVVPPEAIALTCGIDMQKTGFYFVVWAWQGHPQMQSWLIDYGFLDNWDGVYNLIFERTYPVLGSEDKFVPIWRAGLDTGGGEGEEEGLGMTAEAYNRLRSWPKGRIWGTKGMPKDVGGAKISHKILDKMPTKGGSIPIPGGLVLWRINVTQLKEEFFWRLQNPDEGVQAARFHADTGWDFYKQILAEERRLNRQGQYEWVRIRRDNHYLDACVIAHACADPQWAGGLRGIRPLHKAKNKELPQEKAGPWLGERGQGWLRR